MHDRDLTPVENSSKSEVGRVRQPLAVLSDGPGCHGFPGKEAYDGAAYRRLLVNGPGDPGRGPEIQRALV